MSQINIYSQNVPIPVDKFDRLYHILEYSFPETERGNYRFHYNEFSRKSFRSMCFEPDGMPAAFLNYYELQDISAVFVEHFASEAELRGKGIGSALMNELKARYSSMIVLEVEPPENELSERRVRFYQRLGFTLNAGDYFQPSYYGNPEPLPLMLMSTVPLSGRDFSRTAESIHREVYRMGKAGKVSRT